MILLTRAIPFAIGLITTVLLLLVPVFQAWAIALVVLAVFLCVLGIGRLAGFGRDLESWWHVALTPAIFILAVSVFMLFLEVSWMYPILAVASGLFLFFFAEHLFRFIYLSGVYQPYALEHTSLVLHIASMYFMAASFFGLQTFLQFPVWALAIGFCVVAGVMTYETFWISKIRDKSALKIALVGALALTELFVAFALLPSSFYVNAAIVATCFYVFLGVVRASYLHKLSRTVLNRYVITGGALLVILLVTAQWI